jgi:hypothetical protein
VLALEGNYYLQGPLDGLHVGVKIGPQFTSFSNNVSNTSNNHTDLGYGGHIAYDYNLGSSLTFGPEFSVLTSTASNAPTITSIIGVIKLFF